MPSTREWDRGGDEQLPPRVEQRIREVMGAAMIVLNQEIQDIVGQGDVEVWMNLAVSLQRHPGDKVPFLAIASFPDDERVARAFIKKIYNIMEGRGLGEE